MISSILKWEREAAESGQNEKISLATADFGARRETRTSPALWVASGSCKRHEDEFPRSLQNRTVPWNPLDLAQGNAFCWDS